MKVLLEDVISAIDSLNDEYDFYYYIPEECIVSYSHSSGFMDDIEELKEKNLDDVSKDLINLPSKSDRNDYHLMEIFIDEVEDSTAREWLTNSIHGRGAFRMFRATCDRFGLTEDWYNFKEEAYRELAIDWCNENGIEFDDSQIEYDEETGEEIIKPSSNTPITSIVEINKHNLASIVYMANDFAKEVHNIDDVEGIQEDLEDVLNKDNHICSITINGKALGFMILLSRKDNVLLQSIFVKKEDRRKGYGSTLFKHAETLASEEGKVLISRTSPNNEVYKAFLKKNGYATIDYLQIKK